MNRTLHLFRRPSTRRFVGAAATAALVAGTLATVVARSARAADVTPDIGYFRDNVEPVVRAVCAECHAGKGHGLYAGIITHPPGAPHPESDTRINYAIVMKLLVPGKPEQSKFLLKPLNVKGGGVKHEGGERIIKGTAAYKAWVDFINGVKGKPLATPMPAAAPAAAMPAPAPAATMATGAPDLGYFIARIEPVLLGVCAQCHAGAGKGQFALVTHPPGSPYPLADHRTNFETVSRLLTPGKPELSRFLLKPLAERDGGVKHGGGDRISKGDANYKSWTEFINGTKGPPLPEDAPPEEQLPTVSDKGLVLEAESGTIAGDAAVTDGGTGVKVVAPGPAGGRVDFRFRAPRRADYTVSLRAGAGFRGMRLRVDGGEPLDVPAGKDGFADVAPIVPLDGTQPLDGRAGRLVVEGDTLTMDGREGVARWLSPADLPHNQASALVTVPGADEPGRDDAWLLFDCLDYANGKFFGLGDAGRKLVMGVIEAGRPRIVKSIDAPTVGGATPVKLTVDLLDGVAVGRLDGKPALFVNLDRNLGAARFGFQTHGTAVIRAMSASQGTEEVHRVRFGSGAVFSLVKGNHRLEVDMLPQGAPLDSVTVKEASP
jgi:hypothetical protein